MMSRITVARESGDGLSRETWSFAVVLDASHVRVVLDEYVVSARPTKRHGFKATGTYSRIFDRDSTIKEADAPLPDDVATEARALVVDRIVVTKSYRAT